MLGRVERECGPAWRRCGPGDDCVAGKERAPFRPVESEVPRGVARRVNHLQRPNRIAVRDGAVDGTGRMFAESQIDAQLIWIRWPPGADWTHRTPGHGLGLALAGDDVRLPAMGVDSRSGHPLERRVAAEMRAVAMRQHDLLEISWRAAETADGREDAATVGVEEGVD